MRGGIGLVTLLVDEYDEAIRWFTGALDFELVEDSPRGEGKRWVVVAPRDADGSVLLLARTDDDQQSRVGDQTADRVGLFFYTREFAADYERMLATGRRFVA